MLPRKSDISFQDLLPTGQEPQTATRQTSTAQASKTPAKGSILKSYEANCFKSVNSQYELQGRLGVAIYSNAEKTDFKLLLFGTNAKPVTQALLQATKSCLSCPSQPLYVTLLDGYNCYWSLLFDNGDRLKDFLYHTAIVRLYCSDSSQVVEQIITAGDGEAVQMGDTVEFQYSAWIIESDCTKGALFESNIGSNKTYKLKLGQEGAIRGLTNGLLQSKKGTEKILAIPPLLGFGRAGHPPKVPANHALLYHVTVVRTKSSNKGRDGESSESLFNQMLSSQNDEMPLPSLPADENDSLIPNAAPVSVKERTRSITEKLEQPTLSASEQTSKKELLNRMAKMGQAVMKSSVVEEKVEKPKKSKNKKKKRKSETESEDVSSEEEEEVKKPAPKARTKKVKHPISPPDPVASGPVPVTFANVTLPPQQLVPYQNFPQGQNYSSMYLPTMQNMAPAQPAAPANPPPTAAPANMNNPENQLHLSMLVNETRQQNVEMRMAVSKIEDKIEKLRDHLDASFKGQGTAGSNNSFPSLESGMLLQNLTRIIRENDSLKEEIYAKNMKQEELNKRIGSLLQEKEVHFDETNSSIEKRSTAFKTSAMEAQNRVLKLEEEKLFIAKDLSARNEELYNLQKEFDELRTLHRNLSTRHEPLKKEVEDLTLQVTELTETKTQWESSCHSLQKLLKAKEADIVRLTERNTSLESLSQVQDSAVSQRLYRLEEEKHTLQHELENEKIQSMQKIDELQRQLREQKTQTYQSEDLMRSQLEETIIHQWRKKCDELLKVEKTRSNREIKELQEEKDHLEAQLQSLQEKFDDFKKKARDMKLSLSGEMSHLQDEVERLRVELEDAKNSEGLLDPSVVVVKVKGIMNSVFQEFKKEFLPTKSYSGDRIIQTSLAIIRKTTLKMANNEDEQEEEEEKESTADEEENSNDEDASEEEESNDEQPIVAAVSQTNESIPAPSTVLSTTKIEPPVSPNVIPVNSKIQEEVFTSGIETVEHIDESSSSDEDSHTDEKSQPVESDQESSEEELPITENKTDNLLTEEIALEANENSQIQENPLEDNAEEVIADDLKQIISEENPVVPQVDLNPEFNEQVQEVPEKTEPIPQQTPSNEETCDPLESSIILNAQDEPTTPSNASKIEDPFVAQKSNEKSTSNDKPTPVPPKDDGPLFSDDDDDALLKIINPNKNKVDKSKDKNADAAQKVPPPLFGDSEDDDDMSWLH